jgi:CheY-like chemotaxis protein
MVVGWVARPVHAGGGQPRTSGRVDAPCRASRSGSATPPGARQARGDRDRRAAPTGAAVLVADDDGSIRETVVAILEDAGYAVRVAADGAQALAAIDADRPCLVLLDMRMPVLDGWGVAAGLRARAISVPIAVMTAALDAQRWCDEIGADACLPKPFDVDNLLAIAARFCGAGVGHARAAPPSSRARGGTAPTESATAIRSRAPPAGCRDSAPS